MKRSLIAMAAAVFAAGCIFANGAQDSKASSSAAGWKPTKDVNVVVA